MRMDTPSCLHSISYFLPDYLVSLYNVPEGPAREAVKHECHKRCADRLQKLFFKNGGTYIKLGQHVGQLVSILSSLSLARTSSRNCVPKVGVSCQTKRVETI